MPEPAFDIGKGCVVAIPEGDASAADRNRKRQTALCRVSAWQANPSGLGCSTRD